MAIGRWFLTLAVVILASCGVDGEETPAIILVRPRPGTDLAAFARGRALFENAFTPAEGLGPYYNDVSCQACHSDPDVAGEGDYDHRVYRDETRPKHTPAGDTVYGPDEPYHIPPRLFGIGYLNDIPDAQVIAGCGIDESLGIYGVPGTDGTDTPLRFGRDLRTKDVRAFVAGALDHELGISNAGSPDEPKSCTEDPNQPITCGPGVPVDLPTSSVDDLVVFVAGLDVLPSEAQDPNGKELFTQVGCATCHRIDAPYLQGTDLCTHDMGDLMEPTDPQLPPPNDYLRRWATARLSGVRYSKLLLHDGRARTVDDAVQAHDGEGAAVRNAYLELSDADRESLLAFVMSL